MSNIVVALIAYVLDRLFGEVVVKKSPTVYMNEFIAWFEESYYENSVKRGALLLFFLLLLAIGVTYPVVEYFSFLSKTFEIIMSGLIASMFISHKMLYSTSQADTTGLNRFVMAPLLYLLLFGLYGAVIYKVVDTLNAVLDDEERYSHFKVSTQRLYAGLNYIPMLCTQTLVKVLKSWRGIDRNRIDIIFVTFLLLLLLVALFLGI